LEGVEELWLWRDCGLVMIGRGELKIGSNAANFTKGLGVME
jgi:hypothetical protein